MMNFFKKNVLFIIIILGVILRFILLFPDYAFDVNNHIVWAKDLHNYGFNNFFYKQSSEVYGVKFPNYPPLSLFIFYLIYSLGLIIYKFFWWLNVNIPIFPSNLMFFFEHKRFLAGLFKIPSILADFGTLYFIYLFIKKIAPKNIKFQLILLTLFLFNPIIFYNSAFWGQIDIIPIFLVLWSFYMLIYSKKYFISGILFMLSLLVKPTSLVFLPFYFIFFIYKYGWSNFIKTLLVSNILFLFSFAPFLKNPVDLSSSYKIYFEKIISAQSLSFVSNNAFNFWAIITQFGQIKDTSLFLFNISYRFWGYLIMGFFFLFIYYYFLKSKNKINSLYYSLFLCSFVSFLFLTKMHERYIILILPFLLIMSIKNHKFIFWFVLISVIGLLNMYRSWPVPKSEYLLLILNNYYVYVVLSLSNLIIFSHLFIKFKNNCINNTIN